MHRPFIVFGLALHSLLHVAAVNAAPSTIASGVWSLLSVPGAESITLEELVGDDLPGGQIGSGWAALSFDGASGIYQPLALSDTLAPGEGYWLQHFMGRSVEIDYPSLATLPALDSSEACISAQGCYTVELPQSTGDAWSLLGSPFAAGVEIEALRLVTERGVCVDGCSLDQARQAGVAGDTFFAYEPQNNTYTALRAGDVLQPGSGYWYPSALSAATGSGQLLFPVSASSTSIFTSNQMLGRGINLGNALEAPYEGAWGLTLEAYYFDRIADAGFDSVRVPIRWSAYASNVAPYSLDPAIFERVDWVLEQSERTGLATVINVHHYEALMANPGAERDRFLAIWEQIAERYATADENVFFELLNEPTEVFNEDATRWNDLLAAALGVVRASNPQRPVIIGPVGWNAIERLPELDLPDDPFIITTVHFYAPFAFTHQGATWVDPVPPLGVSFDADALSLGASFQDWSWSTALGIEEDGLSISFAEQFAGFNLRLPVAAQPTQLTLEVTGSVNLTVLCSATDAFQTVGELNIADSNSTTFSVDVSACPADSLNVALQNQANGAASFLLHDGELCTAEQCMPLVESSGDVLTRQLTIAATWGQQNSSPVYVGEFGAFSTGDMASRASWTDVVQRSAHSLGMSTAYWEFGSGFGAFDIEQDVWITQLLDGLIR